MQDPQSAPFPSMPRATLAAVPGCPVAAPPALGAAPSRMLADLPGPAPMTTNGAPEVPMGETDDPAYLSRDETRLTRLACPDCGGGLAEADLGGISYFRCHVGHQFSPQALEAAQRQRAEEKLWSAVASLEEHAVVARRLSSGDADDPFGRAAEESSGAARLLSEHLRTRGPAGGGPPA